MKKILLAIMLTSILVAETFTIKPGWNLLGTIVEIPTVEVLANANIKNVVIYSGGNYKATNKNEFTIIPAKSGFFVFSESSTTLSLQTVEPTNTSVEVVKVDGDGNELSADATSWKILYVKDANLYIEMKNDFTVGQSYAITSDSTGEAETYCNNLTIGSISDWHLPTIAELTGVSSIYSKYQKYFTTISNSSYWSSSKNGSYKMYANIRSGSTDYDIGNSHSRKVICVKNTP
jgi:hypothetical protein